MANVFSNLVWLSQDGIKIEMALDEKKGSFSQFLSLHLCFKISAAVLTVEWQPLGNVVCVCV